MKLPATLGRLEARLLAEVVSELSGSPAPKVGASVTAFLERADPSHLLDAARHLCLAQPRRFPPELLEALGAVAKPEPRLHQLVLPEWHPQGVRAEGTLADRLARTNIGYPRSEYLDPQKQPEVSALSSTMRRELEAYRKGSGSIEALATAIEALFTKLAEAFVIPDVHANPWGAEYAETWRSHVDDIRLAKDRSLGELRRLLALVAPDRSGKLVWEQSGLPDPFDQRISAGKLSARVSRDVFLAHEMIAKLAKSEPSLLAISAELATFAEGRPVPLRFFSATLARCAPRLLLASKQEAELLQTRLKAVLRAWPKPENAKERDQAMQEANAALELIGKATLLPGDGPAIARVLWSKDGALHKVELEDGAFAFVRRPINKLHTEVLAGHEVAVSLLHRALGSDRAPEVSIRLDGSGNARTIAPEVPGYFSKMERPFDLQAMLDGPHGAAAATVAFVDLITAAGDLHDANFGTDRTGKMIAVDRELSFRPGAKLPSYWGGVQSIRFPEEVLARARKWSLDELRDLLAPAMLPDERIVELFARLQTLLGSLDKNGRLTFAKP